MSSILTNTGAMTALQTLRSINSNLGMVQDQISTGKKVATAKDNAATYSITTVMKSDVAGFRGISDSLSLGQSTVAVARSAAESVSDLLTEIKGRIVAAQEDNVNRSVYQDDIEQLRGQVESIVNAAQFNGLNLLKNTESTEVGSVDVLASLDRASDGSVTASSINVRKQDLQTSDAVWGTGADNGIGSVGGAGVAANGGTQTIAFAASVAEPSAGDGFRVTFTYNATNYSAEYVARGGDSVNDVANGLSQALNDLDVAEFAFAVTEASDPSTGTASITFTNNHATLAVSALADVGSSDGTAAGALKALADIDVSTEDGATAALASIEGLINTSVAAATVFGQGQSRLEIQDSFVSKLMDGLNTGIGSLVDADMEEASARLQSLQVQQQLGIQAFSIANQAPQNILALFR
ncbi:MAG: flagellin [Alphaproteobacteria bacterium]|nr:flagellin [Alphaproteobacteria bacterium]MCB9928749.1 flagellin [Alphaproteobacteria bacterium]